MARPKKISKFFEKFLSETLPNLSKEWVGEKFSKVLKTRNLDNGLIEMPGTLLHFVQVVQQVEQLL